MTRKEGGYILATIVVCVAVCYYLVTLNATYDGGLIANLTPYWLNMPVIAIILLYKIYAQDQSKEMGKTPLWLKVMGGVILAICAGCLVYVWVGSRFYDVTCISTLVMVLLCVIVVWLERKYHLKKYPVQTWAMSFIAIYLVLAGTVFVYVQVVKPVTMEQATALVEQQYGAQSYACIGRLTGKRNESPLGVYWFANENNSARDWIEMDILTGELWPVE